MQIHSYWPNGQVPEPRCRLSADLVRDTRLGGWSFCQRIARIVGARLRRENLAPVAVVEFEVTSAAAKFEFVW